MVVSRANEENLGECLGVPGEFANSCIKLLRRIFRCRVASRPSHRARHLVCFSRKRNHIFNKSFNLGEQISLEPDEESWALLARQPVNYAYKITSAYITASTARLRGSSSTIKSLFDDFPAATSARPVIIKAPEIAESHKDLQSRLIFMAPLTRAQSRFTPLVVVYNSRKSDYPRHYFVTRRRSKRIMSSPLKLSM